MRAVYLAVIFPFRSAQAYKYIRVYETYGPRLEQYGAVSLEILDMFRDIPAEEFEQLAEENNFDKISVKEAPSLTALRSFPVSVKDCACMRHWLIICCS